MKKNLSRILLLATAMVLALSLCLAHAEEVPAEGEEAGVSTTAFLFWQDVDWWPAVTANEDEYWTPTVANVTGEGYYTVSVKGHMPSWFLPGGNHNRGAQKLAVVIKDGATLFPNYYMQVTDVRVDGVSYPCAAVTYGQTGYDNAADDKGNFFWKANDSYALLWDQWMIDNGGSVGGNTWNSTATAQKFDVFDVSVLDDPKSIEVDFFLSAQQDVKPAGGPALRVINEGPSTDTVIAEPSNAPTVPENATSARMFWIADGWWPSTNIPEQVATQSVTITGEGEYTTNVTFPDQGGWSFAGQGSNAIKLGIVIDNAFGENSIMEGMYVGISDLRVNGQSVELNNPGYGIIPSENYDGEPYNAEDGVVLLYHQYIASLGNDYTNWEGTSGNARPLDGSTLGPIKEIEVDFFVTDTAGKMPEAWSPKWERTWFPNNTMGLAGLSLRDRGMTDKWYNVVPVDLTENGYQVFPMLASNMHVIGNAVVTVSDGDVSVTYELPKHTPGAINIHSECVKWFSSLEEITDEFCDNPTSDLAFGDVVNKADIGDVGYLFICNRLTYCQPIVAYTGISLPRYYQGQPRWKAYRAELEAVMNASAEEAPAAE